MTYVEQSQTIEKILAKHMFVGKLVSKQGSSLVFDKSLRTDCAAALQKVIQSASDLRDHFAGQSLTGIRASKVIAEPSRLGYSDKLWSSTAVAKLAYKDADAMIKERENDKAT